ncbi:hypothetical protein GA0070216_10954 [Micromonospora matsumotoense]|uniref:Uncharacterized protein n=1 Tax=Micromonospora matsumotoense TaxID=121616 RepID=A0A1C4ZBS6_9ACTN|nr:hypothetical protein [Micromonospora matsumotoense]SCF30389.1 hypothetical protein GA0070216_10954 [Micromonospora matsumotoense]
MSTALATTIDALVADGLKALADYYRYDPEQIDHIVRKASVAALAYEAAPPQQALNAYEDQCAPANPRMPMLDDMQQLMRDAYQGTSG